MRLAAVLTFTRAALALAAAAMAGAYVLIAAAHMLASTYVGWPLIAGGAQ